MKINPRQKEGELALKNLLRLTSELQDKVDNINHVIMELEEMGVFE